MNHAERNEKRADRSAGILLAALFGTTMVVGAYAVESSMEYNPLTTRGEVTSASRLFLPESWKFFTRNPQEDQFAVYTRGSDGTWNPALSLPNVQAANLFGLNRFGRGQGVEFALLIHGAKKDGWSDCNDSPVACLERIKVSTHRRNNTPNPSICGDVGVVLQPPVPWAWARWRDQIAMPSRVIRLEVRC